LAKLALLDGEVDSLKLNNKKLANENIELANENKKLCEKIQNLSNNSSKNLDNSFVSLFFFFSLKTLYFIILY
jgi:hypothetical protein